MYHKYWLLAIVIPVGFITFAVLSYFKRNARFLPITLTFLVVLLVVESVMIAGKLSNAKNII